MVSPGILRRMRLVLMPFRTWIPHCWKVHVWFKCPLGQRGAPSAVITKVSDSIAAPAAPLLSQCSPQKLKRRGVRSHLIMQCHCITLCKTRHGNANHPRSSLYPYGFSNENLASNGCALLRRGPKGFYVFLELLKLCFMTRFMSVWLCPHLSGSQSAAHCVTLKCSFCLWHLDLECTPTSSPVNRSRKHKARPCLQLRHLRGALLHSGSR